MPGSGLTLDVLPDVLAVCRLDGGGPVPAWAMPATGLWSVTRRGAELSVVCAADVVPAGVTAQAPWRALVVRGPMAFDVVGVAAALTAPLAAAGIALLLLATFDTDVVLVTQDDLDGAVGALRAAGMTVAG